MLDVTNQKYKEYVKEIYSNQILDADHMKSLLSILIPGRHATELSVRQLSIINEKGDYYKRHFAKRYDFVDLTNKRVYEFDGDQHFSQVNYFDKGNYSNFVDRRNSDLTKQRILVELGYDLVRISGKIFVSKFVDLLSNLNLQTGQSLFIENDNFFITDTKHLSTEHDEIEMLREELFRTQQELLECKDQLSVYEDEKNNFTKEDAFIEFLNDLKIKRFGWREVPMRVAFEYMKKWATTNVPHLLKMKLNSFSKEMKNRVSSTFMVNDNGIKFDSNKYAQMRVLCDILKIDREVLSYQQKSLLYIEEEQITEKEINDSDIVKRFVDSDFYKLDGIQMIPSSVLYSLFVKFCIEDGIQKHLIKKSKTFNSEIRKHLNQLNYSYVSTRKLFYVNKMEASSMMTYLDQLVDFNNKNEIRSSYFVKNDDFITQSEVDDFVSKLENQQITNELNERQLIIKNYLSSTNTLAMQL